MPVNTARRGYSRGNWPAIGLTVLAGLLYVLGYMLSKSLVASHGLSPLQVTFLRCAVVLFVSALATAHPRTGVTWRRILNPAKAWEQRLAAATLVISNAIAVLGYALLPVTAASAIGFTAPLILTLLGGALLREHVSLGRWFGTLLGFGGMLMIVRPGGDASLLGIAASMGGAATYAIYQIVVRRLRDAITTVDIILQASFVGTALLLPIVIFDWRPIDLTTAGTALLMAAVQTAALASIAAALRRGEVSRLAAWQYTGLIWAMVLDAFLLHAAPPCLSVVGGVLVMIGGVAAQTIGRRPTSGVG